MNSVKIIFFDIDGTLVDHATGKIPQKTFEALDRLQKNGILVCIATGRPIASLPDFGSQQFDAFCTFNGSLCYTPEGIIHSHPIPPADVRQILENAAALGRPVSVATREGLVANGWEQDLSDYYHLAGLELTVAEDFDDALKEDVYQIMLGCRKSDHPAVIRNTTGSTITFAWDRAADVIPARSGKAQAIEKILDYFHLDRSQSMAFGDGFNDLEMLQTVGTGVAMGNASPKLKEVADFVCRPVSEDGIYHFCVDQGLI